VRRWGIVIGGALSGLIAGRFGVPWWQTPLITLPTFIGAYWEASER
jgi:hypothetical protein